MRKVLALMLAGVCLLLTACGGDATDTQTTTTVVTTVDGGATTSVVTTVPTTAPTKKPAKTKKTKKTTAATTVQTKPTETVVTTVPTTSCAHDETEKAVCTQGETCVRCGVIVGEPLGHEFADGACVRCGVQSPEQLDRVEVLGITLEDTELSLLVGDSVTLGYTLVPSDATDKDVTFASSNPSAVTVTGSGVITAVTAGDATVTVTSKNGKSAACRVTVRDVALSLPPLPQMFRFFDGDSEQPAGSVEITGVEYFYTQITETDGTLLVVLRGFVQYADDVSAVAPQVQWKVYNADEEEIALGTAEGQPSVGGGSVSMSVQMDSFTPGRYRLELSE